LVGFGVNDRRAALFSTPGPNMSTVRVDMSGKIVVLDGLDIVHFWWLVGEKGAPRRLLERDHVQVVRLSPDVGCRVQPRARADGRLV